MTKIWIFLMKLGHILGCHQLYDRSFKIKGWQFPLCARCTGIFLGQILSIIFLSFKFYISPYILIILMLPLIIDGTSQYLGWQESTNPRRFITGILFGFSYIHLIIYVIFKIILQE